MKNNRFLILLVSTLMVFGEFLWASPSLEGSFEAGLSLFREGKYQKSKALFQQVLREDPAYPLAFHYLECARNYELILWEYRQKTRRLREEENVLKDFLKTGLKAKVKNLYAQGLSMYTRAAYSLALDILSDLLRLDPDHKPALDLADKCRAGIEKVHIERLKNRLLDENQLHHEEKHDIEILQRLQPTPLLEPLINPVTPIHFVPNLDAPTKPQSTASPMNSQPTLETPQIEVLDVREQLEVPVTADFRDAKLLEVLNFLADKARVNIVPSQKVIELESLVSLQVSEMSLEEVLKYLLRNEELTYRIERNSVYILTKEEAQDESVETRIYHLKRGGIGLFTQYEGTPSIGTQLGTTGVTAKTKTIKDLLEEAVDFPKDSKIVLDERTGSLIITNTPTNFQIIERILRKLDIAPGQILIEARFVELNVTDLKELGAEFSFTSEAPFAKRSGKMLQGLKKGTGADFANFSRQTEGINLTFEGVLTKPQFQLLLHAIEERQDAKTLSAPKITTLNNQTAMIKVVDEFVYPTRYEASVVRKDLNSDGDFLDEISGTKETQFVNTPQDFITRDVGIILKVTPSIGKDGANINLILLPEVSSQVGTFSYSGEVSLPKFASRNLSTSVVIGNEETVVLGGLMKETDTKKITKVPFLSDIPFLGNAFKRQTRDTERQNLVIFVTASLLETEGS